MTLMEFEQEVVPVVDGLWPTYKFPPELQKAQHGFMRWTDATECVQALRDQKRRDPDAIKPKWIDISRGLKRDRLAKISDFDTLLAVCRRAARAQKREGCEHATDADVFGWHLDAITFGITHNTVTRQRREDGDGRLAKMAADTRRSEAEFWVRELQETHADVPGYLLTDRRPESIESVDEHPEELFKQRAYRGR